MNHYRALPLIGQMVTVIVLGASGGSIVCTADSINVAKMSMEELVAALDTEHEPDSSSQYEAVSFRRFDTVVGEIIQRRDPESVPLLLRRCNDDTLVNLKAHNEAPWLAWYDTPVRVKYKARFVLEQILDTMDYDTLVGDALASTIDIAAAIALFERKKGEIVGRMRAKSRNVPPLPD